MLRSIASEVLSKKDALQTWSKKEKNNAEARSQQNRLTTLLKSHPCADASPKIHSTSAEHLPPGEHLCETASACQKNFKRLKL